jgi:transposase
MNLGASDLPDDVGALKALLMAERQKYDHDITARDEKIIVLDSRISVQIETIETLQANLDKLRRALFGASSEKQKTKLAADADQLELQIEEQEELAAQTDAAASTSAAPEKVIRTKTSSARKPLPAHLPRERIELAPTISCACGCECARLVTIGEDITEVLEKIPAQLKVIQYVRPKLACRTCEQIFQAHAPELPVLKGRPGPGLIAHVAIAKYCDGLPLYRQSAIFAREGIEIERAVLADWVGRAAWWLEPIHKLIGAHVMAAPAIHSDDTPVKVLAPGSGKTRTGRLWDYILDERPWCGDRPPAAFYCYSPDRKGERPRMHLKDFKGYLHADAYSGYAGLFGDDQTIQHVACFAHARRQFHDCLEATASPVAQEALTRIAALYEIEARINGMSRDERYAVRQSESLPLLNELKHWLEQQRARLSAKSSIGKAIAYSLMRWEALIRYTSDGRLAIDNNAAERALRTVAVSRKNFLFFGSDAGGDRAAIIYTMVESAKLNGLNPQAYITDIIDRMAKGHSSQRLAELLPWNWQQA